MSTNLSLKSRGEAMSAFRLFILAVTFSVLAGCDNADRADRPSEDSTRHQAEPTAGEKYGATMRKIILYYLEGQMSVPDDLAILISTSLSETPSGEFSEVGRVSDVQDVVISRVDEGRAQFNSRNLPTALLTIELKTVNRSAGTYGVICILHGAIIDDEFQMMRDVVYEPCADPNGRVADWKTRNLPPTSSLNS